MTPLGARLRELRAEKGVTLKEMATALGVSSAYLSALEHGRRGVPSRPRLHQICTYFNIIWDEADALIALAERSDPRVTVDTAGLSPDHVALANALSRRIRELSPARARALTDMLERRSG